MAPAVVVPIAVPIAATAPVLVGPPAVLLAPHRDYRVVTVIDYADGFVERR